jgi:GNAT superfamily N-acetyltransferase
VQTPGVQSPLLCRSAGPADAQIIAEFNIRLALETEGLRLDPQTILAGVQAVLADPGKGTYFVAETDGRIVGQCSVTCEWSDWRNGMFWWLQSVYVDAEGRRRGVFTALFDHVLAAARAARAARVIGVRLYVEKDNRPAQTVYERRGMTRTRYDVFELMLEPAAGR